MRWQPLLYGGAVQLLLTFSVWAQTTPPPQSQDITLQTKSSSVPVNDWPSTLEWQKVPGGVGEMLVFPNPPGQEDFVWDKHHLVGTEAGLLRSDAKDQWKIVPSLYGSSVRIAGKHQEQLWVEQAGQGLVALNQDLEVVRRVPTVKGRCIAIESQGFWCLDDFNDNGARTLVEYDQRGEEKRRFMVEGLALAPKSAPVTNNKPTGFGGGMGRSGISWAGADADAVWVCINDYHFAGIGPHDGPMTAGEEQLGRLDRATGKFMSLPKPPRESKRHVEAIGLFKRYQTTQLLNFPGSVQWLTRIDMDTWDVYQLDKRTLQVTRTIRLVCPNQEITTKGNNLWLQSRSGAIHGRETRVYSRENFEPVLLSEAGTPPISTYGYRPNVWASEPLFMVGILGDDETGIWLAAPSQTLLHAGDDGSALAYDVGSALWSSSSRFTLHTPQGQFLWDDYEQLVQIQPDGKVKRLSLSGKWLERGGNISLSLWFLSATRQRVWYYTSRGQLVTLTPDLSQPREIAQGPLFGEESSYSRHQHVSDNRGSVALGDDLYAWADAGHLLRIKGTTGEVSVVESWIRRFPNDESQTSPRRVLKGRNERAFPLPDGRIAFTFSELREIHAFGIGGIVGEQLDKARLWIFDPMKDVWLESQSSPTVCPIAAGEKLYGYDEAQLYEWRANGWVVTGKRPLAYPPSTPGQRRTRITDARVAGTKKYFYQETALGLYRVPWSQIGGR